jgi:signal transduction protein with GAF and PtsI domain
MQVRRAISRGTCAIYVLSEDGTTLEAGLVSGPLEAALRGASFSIGQGLTGWVAANRTTIVNSDARLDVSLPGTSETDGQTCLSTALSEGGALRGVLTLYREVSQPFSPAESRAAETLAPYIAEILGRLSQPRRVQDIRLTAASKATRQNHEPPAAAEDKAQPYCVA